MNPYSHYFLASRLESLIQPDQPGDYYLGAVIPDIRYLARIPRKQTHIDQVAIQDYLSRYPNLTSFLRGYQIHCLLDDIDVSLVVGSAFPLNIIKHLLRRNFPPHQAAILVELFFLQTTRLDWRIAGGHNEVLAAMGILPAQTETFIRAMKEYLPAPSIETALSAFQKIGFIENIRFEKYLKAYRAIEKNKIMRMLLLMSVKNAKLERQAVDFVRSTYRSLSSSQPVS